MLNKDVCKSCIKKVWINAHIILKEYWELNWNDHKGVYCPHDCINPQPRWTSIEDQPPEYCEHKFEHLVAAGMTDVE